MRHDFHLFEGDELHEFARHAVIQRISGREDDRAAAGKRLNAVDDGGERLRPFVDFSLGSGKEGEQALGTNDHFGLFGGKARAGGEAFPTVLAHADDGEPLAHAAPRVSAFTTAAAIAEPPRRPSSVA